MSDCERLALRVAMLEKELARKDALINEQSQKLDRLSGWIDAMLQAAEVRQDELIARMDERRS